MYKMTLGEVAKAIDAEIQAGDTGLVFGEVSTDTRKIKSGSLFICLKGERFDAHDFAADAVLNGAKGLVVSRNVEVSEEIPVLRVKDTLEALQKLASHNRSKFNGSVIAITGSNGKTTTKDMVSSILSQKFQVLKTFGNFNNEIGLPLTLLKLDESYHAVVLEMGMRGLGEIDLLARIAMPTAAVITNIGETHLERLGSIENIALAKTELLPYVPKDGYIVLNGDDQWLRKHVHKGIGRVIFYGMDKSSQIYAKDIKANQGIGSYFTVIYGEEVQGFYLPVPGLHNIYNALASICVGLQEGLSWQECIDGLKSVVLTDMRLQVLESEGIRVIDDTYNANPSSTKAALGILAEMSGEGRRIAVLGDMFELGERAQAGHQEVGETAVDLEIDIIIAVGELAVNVYEAAKNKGLTSERVYSFKNNEEAIELLVKIIKPGDMVLVKGSRGMKMEQIVKGITSTKAG